jgi:hypothetical protein
LESNCHPRRNPLSQPRNPYAIPLGRALDDLFIQRMEGNDEIFNRVINDKQFRNVAQEHLAREVYERVRNSQNSR